MKKEIIILAGGPSSGKTTLINALSKRGFVAYPEISRSVTKKAQEEGIEQLFLQKPLLFSELLLEGRITQYNNATKENASLVFIDRGLPDVLAYMHYIGDEYPVSFKEACEKHRYSRVFFLPPWEDIYESDAERYESYEQAIIIYEYLKQAYISFGYEIIEVPKTSVANRIDFIQKYLEENPL